jgi:hypothetical protein
MPTMVPIRADIFIDDDKKFAKARSNYLKINLKNNIEVD